MADINISVRFSKEQTRADANTIAKTFEVIAQSFAKTAKDLIDQGKKVRLTMTNYVEELKGLGEATVTVSADLSKLAKAQERAGETARVASKAADEQARAWARAKRAIESFSGASGLAFRQTATAVETSIESFIRGGGVISKTMGRAILAVNKFNKVVNHMMFSVGAAFKSIGFGLSNLGRLFTIYLGVPAAASVFTVIKASKDLEDEMFNMLRTTNLTIEGARDLILQFRNIATQAPLTAKELASLAYQAGQLGIRGAPALREVAVTAAMMGRVTETSAEAAVQALGKAAGIFGWTTDQIASNARRWGSVVNELGNTTNATTQMIIDAFNRIAPAGRALGLTESQVLALSASVAALGPSASRAGTQMASALFQMSKNGQKVAQLLGMSFDEFSKRMSQPGGPIGVLVDVLKAINSLPPGIQRNQVALEIFGSSGSKAILAIAGSIDQVLKNLQTAESEWVLMQSLQKEFEKTAMSTSGQMQILTNNVLEVALALGDAVLPVLNQMIGMAIPGVQAVAQVFSELPGAVKVATVALLGLLAVTGPLMISFGSMMAGIGWIIQAMASLSAILGGVQSLLLVVGGGFAAATAAFVGFAVAVLTNVGGVQDALLDMLDDFSGGMENLISNAFDWGANLIIELTNGIVTTASNVLVGAMDFVGSLIERFIGAFSPPKAGPLSNIDEWGKNLIETYLEAFKEADFSALRDVTNTIATLFRNLAKAGAVPETEVAATVAFIRDRFGELVATFRETGEINQAILEDIASRLGVYGDKVAELVRLQLQYTKATERVTEAERALDAARKRREAVLSRIAKLEALGVSSKLLSLMRARADEEVSTAQAELDRAKAAQEAAKAELQRQQDVLKAIADTMGLQGDQLSLLERMRRAAEKAAKAQKKAIDKVKQAYENLYARLNALQAMRNAGILTEEEYLSRVVSAYNTFIQTAAKLGIPFDDALKEMKKAKSRLENIRGDLIKAATPGKDEVRKVVEEAWQGAVEGIKESYKRAGKVVMAQIKGIFKGLRGEMPPVLLDFEFDIDATAAEELAAEIEGMKIGQRFREQLAPAREALEKLAPAFDKFRASLSAFLAFLGTVPGRVAALATQIGQSVKSFEPISRILAIDWGPFLEGIGNFLDRLREIASETMGVDTLRGAFVELGKMLSGGAVYTALSIIASVLEKISKLPTGPVLDKVADSIEFIVTKDLGGWAKRTVGELLPLAAAILGLAVGLKQLRGAFKGAADAAGGSKDALGKAAAATMLLGGQMKKVGGLVSALVKGFNYFFAALGLWGILFKEAGTATLKFRVAILPLTLIFKVLSGAIAGLASSILPVIGAFALIASTVAVVSYGIASNLDMIIDLVKQAGAAFFDWAARIGPPLAKIGALVLGVLMMIWGAVKDTLPSIKAIFGGIFMAIAGIVQAVVGVIANLIAAFLQLITGDFRGAGQSILAAWQALKDGVLKIVNGLVATVLSFFSMLLTMGLSLMGRLLSGVLDILGFKGAAEKVRGVFTSIISIIVGFVNNLSNWLRGEGGPQVIGGLLDALGSLDARAREIFNTLKARFVAFIVTLTVTIVSKAYQMVNGFFDALDELKNGAVRKFNELLASAAAWIASLVIDILKGIRFLATEIPKKLDELKAKAIAAFLYLGIEIAKLVIKLADEIPKKLDELKAKAIAAFLYLGIEIAKLVVKLVEEVPKKLNELKIKAVAALMYIAIEGLKWLASLVQTGVEKFRQLSDAVPKLVSELKTKAIALFLALALSIARTVYNIAVEVIKRFNEFKDGAIATVTALWKGVVTIFGILWGQLVEVVTGIRDAIVSKFQEIWQQVVGWVISIRDGVLGLFTDLKNKLAEIMGGIAATILGPFKWVYNKLLGRSIVPDLTGGTVSAFEGMFGDLSKILGDLPEEFKGSFTDIQKTVEGGVDLGTEQWTSFLTTMDQTTQESLPAIATSFDTSFGDISSNFTGFSTSFAQSYGTFTSNITTATNNFLTNWVASWKKAFTDVSTATGEFITGIKARYDTFWEEHQTGWTTFFTNLLDTIRGYRSDFENVGADLALGLKDGILSKASEIAAAAAQVVRDALDAARREAGAMSPSKVFRVLGQDLMSGLGEGIEDNIGYVVDLMKEVVKKLAVALETSEGDVKDAVKDLSDVASDILIIAKSLEELFDALSKMVSMNVTIPDWTDAFKTDVVDAIVDLVTVFSDALDKIGIPDDVKVTDFLTDLAALAETVKTLVDSLIKLSDGFDAAKEAADGFKRLSDDTWNTITDGIEQMVSSVQEANDLTLDDLTLLSGFAETLGQLVEALKNVVGLFEELGGYRGIVRDPVQWVGTVFEDLANDLQALINSLGFVQDLSDSLVQDLKSFGDMLSQLVSGLGGALDLLNRLVDLSPEEVDLQPISDFAEKVVQQFVELNESIEQWLSEQGLSKKAVENAKQLAERMGPMLDALSATVDLLSSLIGFRMPAVGRVPGEPMPVVIAIMSFLSAVVEHFLLMVKNFEEWLNDLKPYVDITEREAKELIQMMAEMASPILDVVGATVGILKDLVGFRMPLIGRPEPDILANIVGVMKAIVERFVLAADEFENWLANLPGGGMDPNVVAKQVNRFAEMASQSVSAFSDALDIVEGIAGLRLPLGRRIGEALDVLSEVIDIIVQKMKEADEGFRQGEENADVVLASIKDFSDTVSAVAGAFADVVDLLGGISELSRVSVDHLDVISALAKGIVFLMKGLAEEFFESLKDSSGQMVQDANKVMQDIKDYSSVVGEVAGAFGDVVDLLSDLSDLTRVQVRHLDVITALAKGIVYLMKGLADEFFESLKDASGQVVEDAGTVLQNIKDYAEVLSDSAGALSDVVGFLADMSEVLIPQEIELKNLETAAKAVFNTLKSLAEGFFEDAEEEAKTILQDINSYAEALSNAASALADVVGFLTDWKDLMEIQEVSWDALETAAEKIFAVVQQMAKEFFEDMKEEAKGMLQKIEEYSSALGDAAGALSDVLGFIADLKDLVIPQEVAWDDIKTIAENIVNKVKELAGDFFGDLEKAAREELVSKITGYSDALSAAAGALSDVVGFLKDLKDLAIPEEVAYDQLEAHASKVLAHIKTLANNFFGEMEQEARDNLVSKITAYSDALGAAAGALGDVVGFLKDLKDLVVPEEVAYDAIEKHAAKIIGKLKTLSKDFFGDMEQEARNELVGRIKSYADALGAAAGALGDVVGFLKDVSDLTIMQTVAYDTIGQHASKIISKVKKLAEDLFGDKTEEEIKALTESISRYSEALGDAAGALGDVVGFLKDVSDLLIPQEVSYDAIAEHATKIINKIKELADDLFGDKTEEEVKALVESISRYSEALGDAAGAMSDVVGFLKDLKDLTIPQKVEYDALEAVAREIMAVIKRLSDAFFTINSDANDALERMSKYASTLSDVAGAVSDVISILKDVDGVTFKRLSDEVWSILEETAKSSISLIESLYEWMDEANDDLEKYLKTLDNFSGVLSNIFGAVGDAISVLRDLGEAPIVLASEATFSSLKAGMKRLVEIVDELAEYFQLDVVPEALDAAKRFSEAAGPIFDALSSAFDAIGSAFELLSQPVGRLRTDKLKKWIRDLIEMVKQLEPEFRDYKDELENIGKILQATFEPLNTVMDFLSALWEVSVSTPENMFPVMHLAGRPDRTVGRLMEWIESVANKLVGLKLPSMDDIKAAGQAAAMVAEAVQLVIDAIQAVSEAGLPPAAYRIDKLMSAYQELAIKLIQALSEGIKRTEPIVEALMQIYQMLANPPFADLSWYDIGRSLAESLGQGIEDGFAALPPLTLAVGASGGGGVYGGAGQVTININIENPRVFGPDDARELAELVADEIDRILGGRKAVRTRLGAY